MLNLPEITQLQKPLPKTQIYKKFQFSNAQQTKFDTDISRIDIVNEVSSGTIPSIQEGEKVKSFYVLRVVLKTKNYDIKNIEKIAKLISQNFVFVLQYEEEIQLAVFCEKVFTSDWMLETNATISLSGLNFDEVWENIIKRIEGGEWNNNFSLEENIELKEKKEKLQKKIEALKNKMKDDEKNIGEIIIFKTSEGNVSINVRFEGETVWLSQQQMADLYQTSRTNIVEHIKHIYEEEELDADSTCRKIRQVQQEGNRNVSREIPFYNLDMIISLGYRIKSKIATQFRQWATKRLNEYIRKGFTMDDERLKQAGGGDYWKELLARIRDIRSSEKVMYRQVLDLYATSVDYNPKSKESVAFFKMVQNKLHYAINRQTAAEIIYDRADSEKEFMGLTSFKGADVTLEDVRIAKNYLSEKELKKLNALVSAFFDIAEYQAENHKSAYSP